MKSFFREFITTLILAAVIFFVAQATIQTFVIIGTSMQPSFQDGQRLLVNKVVYTFGEPRRGDIVIFQPPEGRKGDYIKRIIALPGDTVEVKMGAVFVNDSELDEPYIKNPPGYTVEEMEVPEDNYFVLGDNRDNSNDSHTGWVVPRDNIIGKAWLSIWPPNSWGLAPNYSLQEQLAMARN